MFQSFHYKAFTQEKCKHMFTQRLVYDSSRQVCLFVCLFRECAGGGGQKERERENPKLGTEPRAEPDIVLHFTTLRS